MTLANPHEQDPVSIRQAIQRLGTKSLGQNADVKHKSLTLTGLTALRLIASDTNKKLVSIDLANWIDGTANKITVTDDGDGTVTLTIPDSVTLVDPTITGILDASAGEVLTQDNATSAPTGKSDGYVGVAKIGSDGRIYFVVEGVTYYVDGTPAAVAGVGEPIGLLLALTYA
ncbi:MAG: hypothetical protein ACXABY_05050 [Candidatus Thorarchaeota archaeon]|jgi:hypothetical protein